MADVRWIKIIVDVFDDEKIRLIETLPDSDMILVIWFKLLTLAGKCNDGGLIYLTRDIPYNPETLSTILRRPVNTIRLALGEFQKLGMIEIFNDIISIMNWEKHQSLHKLEMAKEQTRLRVQRHREGQKKLCNVTVTMCNDVTETESNADREDKNRIDKKRKEKNIDNDSFEIFWDLYNHKFNKKKALAEWIKIKPELHQTIYNHVREYRASERGCKFPYNPNNYLKDEHWNDEITTGSIKPQKPSVKENLQRFEDMEKTL